MQKPKKSLGQNFLIDKNIIKKIVSTVNIKRKNIVEIGPGTGNLTRSILENEPRKLITIEKDEILNKNLKIIFSNDKNLVSINNDILNFNLEKELLKDTIIFGNLPYNISTKILTNLIKFKKWPPNYNYLVLMFQKELAERIIAKPKSSKYGRLSIISNYRLKIDSYFHISKNCFFPKPKVDSTLIVFKPYQIKNRNIKDLKNLEKITNIFFSGKRKMINKSFNKLFEKPYKFSELGKIDLSLRPSDLDHDTYYFLTECYENLNKF